MEIAEILRQFATSKALPLEAIEAARLRRDECVPVFLCIVEEAIAGDMPVDDSETPIFLVFHMLGGEFR